MKSIVSFIRESLGVSIDDLNKYLIDTTINILKKCGIDIKDYEINPDGDIKNGKLIRFKANDYKTANKVTDMIRKEFNAKKDALTCLGYVLDKGAGHSGNWTGLKSYDAEYKRKHGTFEGHLIKFNISTRLQQTGVSDIDVSFTEELLETGERFVNSLK